MSRRQSNNVVLKRYQFESESQRQTSGWLYQPNFRRGYSLLEVLLALALSVAIFSAIAMGVRVHLISLTRQQAIIERKQIARSVISMISNDLRAGIQYKALDYSGLENLLTTQALLSNSLPSSIAGIAGEEEVEPPPEDEESDTGESEEMFDEEVVSFRPSLLGTENVIMIDISRLPRIDQYNPLIASAEDLVFSPSDVKSVAYFASQVRGGAETAVQFDEEAAPGGLYRREVDRAVAAYGGDFSLVETPDPYTKLIAPEVAQMGFRYWDGEDWQTSWDSEENEGFPVAIEIQIVIDPARLSPNNKTYSFGGFDAETMEFYRSVIHLPVAEPPPEEE
jgi:type II secretory pathway pseudopilin PulG